MRKNPIQWTTHNSTCVKPFKKENKMKKLILTALLILPTVMPAVAAVEGMIDVESSFSVMETTDRLEGILKEKGMTVFNRVKHSQSASEVGIELRDTELLIFGNPKAGSPLMKCAQTVAIDLPQKALVWQDENEKVWISYNDPRYLEQKHSITGCEKVIANIENALANFAQAAAK
jgi:uncharacterized protein (DUF302 family)